MSYHFPDLSQDAVCVVAVSANPEDHRALAAILNHSNWRFFTASTCAETAEVLSADLAPVILCEAELADGGWRDIRDLAAIASPCSRILVASRHADDRLWSEVLNEGGYDCLAKPFHPEEVFRLISLAWQSGRRELARRSAFARPSLANATVV